MKFLPSQNKTQNPSPHVRERVMDLLICFDSNREIIDRDKLWKKEGTAYKNCGQLHDVEKVIDATAEDAFFKAIKINPNYSGAYPAMGWLECMAKHRHDKALEHFDEALKQARQEPVTRPEREFDLD